MWNHNFLKDTRFVVCIFINVYMEWNIHSLAFDEMMSQWTVNNLVLVIKEHWNERFPQYPISDNHCIKFILIQISYFFLPVFIKYRKCMYIVFDLFSEEQMISRIKTMEIFLFLLQTIGDCFKKIFILLTALKRTVNVPRKCSFLYPIRRFCTKYKF